jgi:hypothetical protein
MSRRRLSAPPSGSQPMTETITMTFAALAVLWNTPTEDAQIAGMATYSNRMAEVAYNRGYITDPLLYLEWLDQEGLAGAAAGNRRADIGRKVWIDGPLGLEGPFLLIDCAKLRHLKGRLQQGRAIEVDHITAVRWGMVKPIPVDVYFQDPQLWDPQVPARPDQPVPI